MIKKYLFIIAYLLCSGEYTYAIEKTASKIPDTLRNRNYDYLFDKIENHKKDNFKQSIYLQTFLKKAKSEKNWEEIINGYKNYLHHSDENLKLIYADSMVYTAKKSKDNALIGSAYLSKGIVYYGQKKHSFALDNYLIANEYIAKTNDSYLKYKVKYNIAHIKYYLGYYHEAVSLFKECIEFFKKDNDRAYLNTIHSLALCYNKIGDYGLSSEMSNTGLSESKRLNNNEMEVYFVHSEGINQYCKNNYASAIEKITYSLSAIKENKDFANETIGYFYIGKSYWALKKPEIAIAYFRKVDKAFEDKEYIRPDLRENYELMIDYYKLKDNPKMQLYYVEKLILADKVLDETYKYLIGKIHKEYDTKGLLKEKHDIQNLLNKRKKNDVLFISAITFFFFLSLFLAYRYLKNKKVYRQKFEELMKKNEVDEIVKEVKIIDKTILDINPDAVSVVLKQLEKFERDKKFLEKDWTLVKLSADFNSNTKYLSKIIFHYRDKKFVEYLNDLRIDYIIELLKKDKVIRNYTNKALAEEAGFSSTQRFTNAFISRTEISPSYFIQELKKEMSVQENKNEC